jgi:ParB-like chromosome segregation protein Spo0J
MDVAHLKDLKPDPANARRHTPRNVGLIVDALHEVGAARSIVIDEDGVILAGNATAEAAAEAGLTKVQVVDADGQTVVAVRRTGLTPVQKARLALYDNRAAELADGWKVDVLQALQADGVNLDGLWTDEETRALLPEFIPVGLDEQGRLDQKTPIICPACGHEFVPK